MKKFTTYAAAAALTVALTATVNAGPSCGTKSANTDKATAQTAAAVSKVEKGNIVETAIGAGSFNTLVTAVKAAGLVEALQGDGPFTVFAPTDEAFAALPEGTIEKLLADKEMLTAILTYHVVAGEVKAADVIKLDKAETLQGQNVTVTMKDDKVMINGATVIKADVMASNGVIHVIDRVIMPDMKKN